MQVAAPSDPDQRENFIGSIHIEFVAGASGRASNLKSVLKRASESLGDLTDGVSK